MLRLIAIFHLTAEVAASYSRVAINFIVLLSVGFSFLRKLKNDVTM